MKIATWNVNGLRSATRKGLLAWLSEERPDVLCMQETKLTPNYDVSDFANLGYMGYMNNASRSGYSGTAIFSKRDLQVEFNCIEQPQFTSEGRAMFARLKDFDLINLYMPHGSRDKSKLPYKLECYKELLMLLWKQARPTIIVGDLNIAHSELDLARPKQNVDNVMFTQEERNIVTKLLNIGFVDLFRSKYPEERKYTWWPYAFNCKERNIGWRIDYMLATNDLLSSLSDIQIQTQISCSDHCPIVLNLNV